MTSADGDAPPWCNSLRSAQKAVEQISSLVNLDNRLQTLSRTTEILELEIRRLRQDAKRDRILLVCLAIAQVLLGAGWLTRLLTGG